MNIVRFARTEIRLVSIPLKLIAEANSPVGVHEEISTPKEAAQKENASALLSEALLHAGVINAFVVFSSSIRNVPVFLMRRPDDALLFTAAMFNSNGQQ